MSSSFLFSLICYRSDFFTLIPPDAGPALSHSGGDADAAVNGPWLYSPPATQRRCACSSRVVTPDGSDDADGAVQGIQPGSPILDGAGDSVRPGIGGDR